MGKLKRYIAKKGTLQHKYVRIDLINLLLMEYLFGGGLLKIILMGATELIGTIAHHLTKPETNYQIR